VRDIIPYHLLEHSLSCKYSLYPVLENKTDKKRCQAVSTVVAKKSSLL
jgi:hypothetical protein